MNPDRMTSMRQDRLAHRRPELEMFAGTVIKIAKKHNIDLAVNKKYMRRL